MRVSGPFNHRVPASAGRERGLPSILSLYRLFRSPFHIFLCLCATGLQAATAFYVTHAHKRPSSATPVTCPNPHNPFGGSRRERIPTRASTMEANGGHALRDKTERKTRQPRFVGDANGLFCFDHVSAHKYSFCLLPDW